MIKAHKLVLMAFFMGGLLGCFDVVELPYTEDPVHIDTFDQIIKIRYTWSEPTVGTDIAYYVGQLETNGLTEPQYKLKEYNWTFIDMTLGRTYRFRVAGVDDEDIQGPFSIFSAPYTPARMDTL